MTIYAVGDIHGCLDDLRRVLDAISADATKHGVTRPRVVFLGDYVDRGPDGKGVLDLLAGEDISLGFDPVFLLGNHDAVMLSTIRDIGSGNLNLDEVHAWLIHGGAQTIESYGVTISGHSPRRFLHDFACSVPGSHLSFLSGLLLYYREPGLFFSHAGVDPEKPLDQQSREALLYGDEGLFDYDHEWLGRKLREKLNARIIHGHWAKEAGDYVHRICVDTGAGYPDFKLSAVAIDGEAVRWLP
jgi:serine/threonine protein phosphatase 1